MLSLISQKISQLLHKPRYILDENISGYCFSKPSSLYLRSSTLVPRGTSDEELLKKANEKNRIVITRDVKFVISTVIKKQKIIYETNEGHRFLFNGKTCKQIHQNEKRLEIKQLSKRQKKMLDFANRTPFHLPLNGFYMVCFL